MGKTSVKSVNKYIAKAYDRINFVMPKGRKEEIKKCADADGVSASEWINQAIIERMAGSTANVNLMNLAEIKDLQAYARSAGLTMKEYVLKAVEEAMHRQDRDFVEDVERVNIE
jgi:hypothetical protein